MSRDKKRQMFWYQVNDSEAVARHLEKMAAKGWLLEGVDNWYFTYRRAEPVEVKYAVTYFPEASVYDPGLTEGQETYADYCQAAGWELAGAYGPVQYFRSTRPDPVPIETDEAVKLNAIRRTMRKTFVLAHVFLLVIPLVSLPAILQQIRWGALSFFSSNISVGTGLMMASIALYCVGLLLDYLVWLLRSRYAVARGGTCVKPHTRARLWATDVLLAVCVVAVGSFLIDQSFGLKTLLLVFLALYTGIMLLSRWVLRKLKQSGSSRENIRGIMIALAIGVGLVMGIGTPFLSIRLADAGILHTGREPAETYTKTYENVSWSYTVNIFYDELPVTLEDLGYAVTPEDHCSYEAAVSRSPLAVHRKYTQEAFNSDSHLPRLFYQSFETRWSWVLEICWERLLAERRSGQELDPAPWGAEEAYRDEEWSTYLLRYPDRIITMNLWYDATPEQMETVVEALRS